jgi:cobalt-zinc-cadmium efflux system outer membrane protein
VKVKRTSWGEPVLALFLLLTISFFPAYAQDTLHISFQQSEELFLKRNLTLISQRFNVPIAEAAVTQSKLWDNPSFWIETNAYNPKTGKVLDWSKQTDALNPSGGVFNLQVSQLISLTRQRSKLVQLSQTAVELQQFAYDDVMRILHHDLAVTYGNIYSGQQQLKLLKEESQDLQALVNAFEARVKAGSSAPFELTRLQIEQQNLNSLISQIANGLQDDEANLRVLLSIPGTSYYIADQLPVGSTKPVLSDLVEKSLATRPDVLASSLSVNYQNQNLTYQKSLAVPKLAAGIDYQKYGGPFPSFYGITASMDLPVKNRNQGNIQAARIQIDQSRSMSDDTRQKAEQDVKSAYEKWITLNSQQQALRPDYIESLQEIGKNAIQDYQKRIIDQVSFMDKWKSYKEGQLSLIQLQTALYQSQQNINYVTNTRIF